MFLPFSHLLPSKAPKWQPFTPCINTMASISSGRPIHVIVVIAVAATIAYTNLLEFSLFEKAENSAGLFGFGRSSSVWTKEALVGGVQYKLGEKGRWHEMPYGDDVNRLALVTLQFPDVESLTQPIVPSNATNIPSLKTLPHDLDTRVYALPYASARPFLTNVAMIGTYETIKDDDDGLGDTKANLWVVKQVAGQDVRKFMHSSGGYLLESWNGFKELIEAADSLDILIMLLGYLSMWSTFVSLFVSMRKLGSRTWLGVTVIISSAFAFFFACHSMYYFRKPMNLVVMSEGLPFLVVMIGFEKPIILTKAVLEASDSSYRKTRKRYGPTTSIQDAVCTGVQEKGWSIFLMYFIELSILAAGWWSDIQGGFSAFCLLSMWILFWDGVLLFTFYTAVLCIKLEFNRIKRHVTTRKALEEEGVSRRAAEDVANSYEAPRDIGDSGTPDPSLPKVEPTIFGMYLEEKTIARFKFWMIFAFVTLTAVEIMYNKAGHVLASVRPSSQSPKPVVEFDAVKTGSRGLDMLAKSQPIGTVVEIVHPIVYAIGNYLITPAARASSTPAFDQVIGRVDEYVYNISPRTSELFSSDAIGGRMVQSLFRSLEDPVFSKYLVLVLIGSLVLNGYLFNIAKWSIKDGPERDREELSHQNGHAKGPVDFECKRCNNLTDTQIAQVTLNAESAIPRSLPELVAALASDPKSITINEGMILLSARKIAVSRLEGGHKIRADRAVKIRRQYLAMDKEMKSKLGDLVKSKLPDEYYDFQRIVGACCENVIGFTPVPCGLAGPIVIDGETFYVPMATTEGVLVASTCRGSKAINSGGGATTALVGDGMTRGPCVSFDSLARAAEAKFWLDNGEGFTRLKTAFQSTTSFGKLVSIKSALAGTYLYIRFKCTTGDAMGMNMISKGVEASLKEMKDNWFSDMSIISVSGNYCTDKKAAAVNWIDGRGKSVVAEARISAKIVETVLKSSVEAMVELNTAKNLIGSAMAGAMGGFNAHAANIVAAIFVATGQDPAQVVESANCITVMRNVGGDLLISVSMPSIEVGTMGGGTILEPQGAMLDILGVRGGHPTEPGSNARKLARIVAATVLAGELSLCGALAAGHLVRAHMEHNRSAPASRVNTPAILPAGLKMTSSLKP